EPGEQRRRVLRACLTPGAQHGASRHRRLQELASVDHRLQTSDFLLLTSYFVPPVAVLLTPPIGASATHAKFAASSVLPVPFHRATCGYRHRGRVRSTFPFTMCEAIILSGAA